MSKERLTGNSKELIKCYGYTCEEICRKHPYTCTDCPIAEGIIKLAEYEDLEEQGLLFRLPCNCKDCKHVDYAGCAGTTCYCMKNDVFMQEDDFCKYAEKDEAEEKLRELEKSNV